jgi:hypothetical protein
VTVETECLQEGWREADEYWVLETAVEDFVPLSTIWGESQYLKARWNKRAHSCSRNGLVGLLLRLARAGDIVFIDENLKECGMSEEKLIVQLESVDWTPEDKYYGLTLQGGERWEQSVTLDWSRYYSFERTGDLGEYCEIASSSPSMANRAFQYVVHSLKLCVDESSVKRDMLSPWHATYWKTLKVGASIRFEEDNQEFKETKDARNLFAEELFFRYWYTSPSVGGAIGGLEPDGS